MIRLSGAAGSRFARRSARFMRLAGFGSSYIPGGGATAIGTLPFAGNPLTSDPVRYARTVAVLEAEPALGIGSPTVGWLDAAFRTMNDFADPGYVNRLRQPLLLVAAGRDQIVSTTAASAAARRSRSPAPRWRHAPRGPRGSLLRAGTRPPRARPRASRAACPPARHRKPRDARRSAARCRSGWSACGNDGICARRKSL